MAKPGSINPLMLLIIAQAWCHVKRASRPGFDLRMAALRAGRNKSSPEHASGDHQEEGDLKAGSSSLHWSLAAHLEEDGRSNKLFSPEGWTHLLAHPFFQSTFLSHPLSLRRLVKSWSQAEEGFWCVQDQNDLEQFNTDPKAIKVKWDPAWSQDIPTWATNCLQYRTTNNAQVWMEVPPTPQAWHSLNEHVWRRSIQLGWAWWITPPSADQFPAWMNAFRPCWKMWLHHPNWDQWVWPWSDILVKKVVDHLMGESTDRPWVLDQRCKVSWTKIEDEVLNEVEKVMGGPTSFRLLIASVVSELDRMDASIQAHTKAQN